MLDPVSKSNRASGQPSAEMEPPFRTYAHRSEDDSIQDRYPDADLQPYAKPKKRQQSRRLQARSSLYQKNIVLKRLDALYWKRVMRYLHIRFLRMRSSPGAIARGAAAGAFAGSFPFIGLQTIIGVAIASVLRGSKVIAAASTLISNPLTYVPLFALNFHIGRLLLRLPPITSLPASPAAMDEWLAMGKDVAAAMMLGSLIVAIAASLISYYIALQIARHVQKAKAAKRRR